MKTWHEFAEKMNSSSVCYKTDDPQLIFNLNQLSFVLISGVDAQSFLQGQVTCDLTLFEKENSVLPGGLCEIKGRLVATFLLLKLTDEQFLLLFPNEMLNIALKRLKKYALFSKVTLEDVTEKWAYVGYSNPKATPGDYHLTNEKEVLEIHYPGTTPLSLFLSKKGEALRKLCEKKLTEKHSVAPTETWNYLLIKNRLASIYPTTSNLLTPQMIALEKYNGVSFSKGCYLGQEIIARTQHLGKLKRHLQLIDVDKNTEYTAGTPVMNKKRETLGILLSGKTPTTFYSLGLAVLEDRGLTEQLYLNSHPLSVIQP